DILVDGKTAHVFCHENMAPFLMQELCRVRHTNVVPKLLDALEDVPVLKTEKVSGTVSSVRLDSVIALAFSTS
ncbi:RNA-binding protein, partial [Extibacter sp. GGCC_0201]|nr:RNA-binding protein [Extibacter sp. GGCC_0201]